MVDNITVVFTGFLIFSGLFLVWYALFEITKKLTVIALKDGRSFEDKCMISTLETLKDGYRDMLDSFLDKTGCLTPDDVVNKFQQLEKENKVLREDYHRDLVKYLMGE